MRPTLPHTPITPRDCARHHPSIASDALDTHGWLVTGELTLFDSAGAVSEAGQAWV